MIATTTITMSIHWIRRHHGPAFLRRHEPSLVMSRFCDRTQRYP
jgi:hypothetical protein